MRKARPAPPAATPRSAWRPGPLPSIGSLFLFFPPCSPWNSGMGPSRWGYLPPFLFCCCIKNCWRVAAHLLRQPRGRSALRPLHLHRFFFSLSLAVFLLVISRRVPEGAFPVRPPYLPFYFALKKRTVGWTGRSSSCGDPEGWSARPLFLSFFLAVSPWEVGTLGGIKGPSYRCLYDAWPSCAYICVYLRDSTPLSSPFSPSPGGAGARGALRQLQHDEPVGLDDAAARAGGHDRGALWGGAGRPFSRQGGPS